MASSPLDSATSRPSSAAACPSQRMPSRSRTQSISSDRPSTVATSLMSPPLSVSPEPAFIAASAASQIVTNEAWYDQHGIEPSREAVAVSPGALQLVNSFLDQLLFNILCVSRCTTLAALRPAVSEVLKPKLAKDAINQADEELREYRYAEDEDGPRAPAGGAVSAADWDVELAWKRTRLRCMVFSSLGDMEEEDEDYYMEQGHLDSGLEDRFSEAVSPAVAIFLTSILEFMGEQALVVAGQAAYHRVRLKYEKELKEGSRTPTGVADRIVIEDADMERVALDRTLGRLWRTWKKKIRSPAIGTMDRLARSYSKDSLRSGSAHIRSPSSAAELAVPTTVREPDVETGQGNTNVRRRKEIEQEEGKEDSQEPLEEYLVAAAIPLPLGPDDIAEILVPGLAPCSDGERDDDGVDTTSGSARPKSLVILPSTSMFDPATLSPSRPDVSRKRSSSLPAVPHASQASWDEPSVVRVAIEAPPEDLEHTSDVLANTSADGPTAGAHGLRTKITPSQEIAEEDGMKDDDDGEVSIEEPRIVRSSRVSILGRSPSAASSEYGKPTAINTNLPFRTPSIHSARLIEVTSPRSPVVGSQRSSVVMTESGRQSAASQSSRTATPPIPEDRSDQTLDKSTVGRLTVASAAKSALAKRVSVSETEAAVDYNVSPITPSSPTSHTGTSLAPVPEPVTEEQYEEAEEAARSEAREPSTPSRRMKVTILPATSSPASTASTTSGTFFIESMPVLPEGREAPAQSRADDQRSHSASGAKPPVVPERNAGRQAVANTSALRQPATVGQVSVERSRTRSPSQGSSSRPRDHSAGRTRQQTSGSPSSAKLKVVRSSEEGMQARIDVVRNFEELIQSDQTIQYTLTPENMRDDFQSTRSASGSPVVSVKTRKSEEARQNGSRSRSSSVPRSDARTPPAPAAPRSAGSLSHSSSDLHQASRNSAPGTGKHGGVVPRSTPPVPSKSRVGHGPQARDARLGRESLAEFAEFIRSTGPAGGSVAPPTPSSASGRIRTPGSISNVSIETGRVSTTSNPNRPRFQARGPTVDHKDDNSDLIDFIRRGPPSGPGNHRIPRSVAPFRTTMDSDQFSGAAGGRAVDAQLLESEVRSSQGSINATESSVPPSIQSSVNSHSGLLARSKAMSYDTVVQDDMPMPQRKTRRVRDPYAIDFSDEELDELDDLAPVPKKRAQTHEESLIDFLNNYSPPPEPTVQPLNIAQTRNTLKPKKKASAPSLMARLTRRDSGQSGSLLSNRPASPKVTESRNLGSRASGGTTGHVPIQVNIPSGADVYTPPVRTSSKAAAMMGGIPGPVAGRVPMKKFEPREAVSVHNRGTSDLADFLKHSGPPPGSTPMMDQLPGPAGREESNGVAKMFGRRKKSSIS